MKMEVAVAAPSDGTVQQLLVKAGQQVTTGQELASLA
jgi:biotin carboxyl carrier protein